MPRISKRNTTINKTKIEINQDKKIYSVAIYTRLSVDTDGKKNESIETQIEIISKYINNNDNMQVYDTYSDIGKTGTNFEREEFLRMLQDIRLGDVNCVIVKDLSRFARNYIETGNYLEKIFPFMGVRFISVSDGFDTEDVNINDKKIGMNIKNLINEMYAKDSSKRTRVQIRQRMEQGIYVGSINPYGYYTIKGDKKRVLYPEKQTSDVVKIIFENFYKNHNINGVVRLLADMRINPASVYQKTNKVICPNDVPYKAWATESVKRILKNPIYLGMLVQGKSSCLGRTEENRKWLDESEWIVVKNTHKPLVNKAIFDEIQDYFKEQERVRLEKEKDKNPSVLKENVFHDVIVCGCCKRPMQRVHHNESFLNGVHRKEVNVYSCEFAYNVGDDRCESNRINEDKITELLLSVLTNEFKIYLNRKKDFVAYNNEIANKRKSDLQKEINLLNQKIRRMEEEIDIAYRSYREDKISSNKFSDIRSVKARKIEMYQDSVNEISKKLTKLDKEIERQNKAIKSILCLKNSQVLTKELVNSLVDKIVVYPGKRIEIQLRFTNELLKGDIR